MKKRILTIVLALIMVCSLLPVTAMALDDTLTVAGTNVVSGANITYWLCNNDGTITSSGASESNYNVKYDPTANPRTLTLNNANIAFTTGRAIDIGFSVGSLMIRLEGINTVTTTGNAANGIHQANGPLTITAENEASLEVRGTNLGIHAASSLTISGKATVTAVGGDQAIATNGNQFSAVGNFVIYAGADKNSAQTVNSPGANKYVSIEPTTAPAVTTYDLWVGGVQVTSANAADVLGDGKVSYAPATKTLTLNGATITGNPAAAHKEGIYSSGADLTIDLTGTNEITVSGSNAILIDGKNLTIEGSGTLTATSSGYCIQVHGGDLAISGVTVSATGTGDNDRGIVVFENGGAGGGITISSSTVTAKGETYGICASNSITISGSTVTADATTTASGRTAYAISAGNRSITITDSTVTATAASPYHSYGISYSTHNNSGLTIINSTVTAKGEKALTSAPSLGNTNWYQWTTTEGSSMTKSTDAAYTYEATHTYLKIELISAPTTVHVTGVTLNKTSLALTVGDAPATLSATVAPSNATSKAVTWSSSNSAVATVDNSGKVTAVAAGTATITVTTADGSKTATCAVTVTAATTYRNYFIYSATLSEVRQVLSGVADVTSNDGVITIKLTSNINGRLDFDRNSGKFVLDMNDKTIDAGTKEEALCLNNRFTGTVKVIGSGTFKTGCNNIVYGGNKLTVGLSEGKDYLTLVKDGQPVSVDVNTGTPALSTFVIGEKLVLTQCNGTVRTITFHANGGTGTMAAASALDGTNYTLPSCTFTAPSGKEFKGWATTANGTVLSGTTLAVTANVDLYAIWEETTQGGGNGGGNQGGNNPTPPAPTYPSYNPPVITTPSVDVDDSTLNDAAGALGSAVLDSKAEIVPAVGYTVEKIAKLQSEGKLNLVIDKKASYDAVDKALVDAAAAKKAALCTQYLDIDAVLKTDSGEVVATVKNTVKPLTITIALSAEMQQAAKDGKTLLVVRCHEGKCDYLNGTLNAEKTEITIQSAQFSTYAVIAVESDAAKTFDGGVALYGAMALLSVGGGAALVIGKKRKD